MKNIYIAGIILALISQASCESDYSGTQDSGAFSVESMSLSTSWKLNLDGTFRHRFPLNGAIAAAGSFVCSPLSALLPLGKLAVGATGKCKEQLYTAIGVSSTSELYNTFKSLMKSMHSVSGVELKVCSKIYVSKELSVKPKFKEDAQEIFKSSIIRINLQHPDKVARKINNWVNERTKGMIRDIIQPGDISADSSVILVNAVYFSGAWEHHFSPARMQDFFLPTQTRQVPMMTRSGGKYLYAKIDALDCQVIDIPYKGGEASFVIMLPNSKDGLTILLYKLKLAPELIQTAMAKMKMEYVIVSIPKFKTSTEIDLKNAYLNVGLTDMMNTRDSGLTGIVKDTELSVSKAIQKAVIEVDEHGTKAAAVSVMEMVGTSLIMNEKVFLANKPFYYFIKIKKDIIFSGVFVGS